MSGPALDEALWGEGPLAKTLVPDAAVLHLDELFAEGDIVTLVVTATSATACCPVCGQCSTRVHSRYNRAVADLPWQGLAVRIHLQTRRWFCPTPSCERRIFAERLPAVVAPYARRTRRLAGVVEAIALALGGEGGARLLDTLGVCASPDALLHALRTTPLPAVPSPRVLGIDDWAWRRGRRFGTILVDLERHRVVDLLPDRSADAVADWLARHPGVEIVSRGRGGLYADGAARGAPEATQVADRWHLLNNLGAALERFLLHKREAIRDAATADADTTPAPDPPAAAPRAPDPQPWQARAEMAGRQRHEAQVAQYEAIGTLRAHGADIADIARTVGVSRETVYRYLRLPGPPARMRLPRRGTALDPHLPYLLERGLAGCHNGKRLWREIRERGYTNSYANVARVVARWRREARGEQVQPGATPAAATGPPTPRQVAGLMLGRPERLSAAAQEYLAALCARDEAIAAAHVLTREFTAIMRGRRGDQLDAWLRSAGAGAVAELRRFAAGLETDRAAVQAGLTLPWSNGQVEGQIHRLKLVKRMYGRGNFDLIRKRALHAA